MLWAVKAAIALRDSDVALRLCSAPKNGCDKAMNETPTAQEFATNLAEAASLLQNFRCETSTSMSEPLVR